MFVFLQVLLSLPDSAERCLPPEAMEAAAAAMSPDSNVTDEARQTFLPPCINYKINHINKFKYK